MVALRYHLPLDFATKAKEGHPCDGNPIYFFGLLYQTYFIYTELAATLKVRLYLLIVESNTSLRLLSRRDSGSGFYEIFEVDTGKKPRTCSRYQAGFGFADGRFFEE